MDLLILIPQQAPEPDILLIVLITLLPELHLLLMAILAVILLLHLHTLPPVIGVLLPAITLPLHLREPCLVQGLSQLLPASVRKAFTGCLIPAVGVWLMAQHMCPAALNIIQAGLLPQAHRLQEDIIAAASLLTLLLANVKTAPAPGGLTGTAQNV